jgi:ADP-ribose pyrophosphatase
MASWQLPANATRVFKGVIFEVWQWNQEMYDGSTALFEVVKRQGTVVIIARVGGTFLIQEQEQPHVKEPFLTLTSGRVEEGEEPLAAAQRELLEETGYEARTWKVFKHDDGKGKLLWPITTFVATDLTNVSEPRLDGGEKITARLVSFDELIALQDDPRWRGAEIREECLRARYDEAYKARLLEELGG